MPALLTKNLEKHFDGVHAVDHLSIQFEPGKITGVIGPNGSGKSTLINAITGIHKMDGGAIVVGEKTSLSKMNTYDVPTYEITRTFQDVRLFEQMTVLPVYLTARENFWKLPEF